MAEDKEQYKKSIRFFNDREVRAVWTRNTVSGGSQLLILFEPSITNLITLRLVTIGDGLKGS